MEQNIIDELRNIQITPRGNLINGKISTSLSGETIDVVSPIDGNHMTMIPRSRREDVDLAVNAAKLAFDDGRWSNQPPVDRKKVLIKWAELVEKEALSLAVLGVRENGTEINMALKAEPFSAAATLRYYGEAIDKVYGEIAPTAEGILGLIKKEPIGVVGAIVPWNFPLMIGAWKIGPALAAGNSVILKPAESASLSLLRLAELGLEAGLPPGVLQVVTGYGSEAGQAIALSKDVDVLTFTGAGPTGRKLMEFSAQSNLKRVYLELGGKSPNIVFSDAPDLELAAKSAVNAIFRNSGQVCVAGSRLLVEHSIYQNFLDKVCNYTTKLKVGDPLDLSNDIGAVHSEAQLLKNLRFLDSLKNREKNIVLGGDRLIEESGGFYMSPTIVENINSKDEIFHEEIFGPVLSVIPFSKDEEAISIANDTSYGLAAGVWTSNLSRAHKMANGIKSGMITVNTYAGTDMTVPLPGMKESGNGSDKSLHSLEKYTNLKTIWVNL